MTDIDTRMDTRVAVLEVQRAAHDKICDERERRVETNIDRISNTMERESGERLAGLARVHERIDVVSGHVSSMKATLASVPESITSAVRDGVQGTKFWAVMQALGVAVLIISFLVDHFVFRK